jgi:hypothetical protein
MRMGWSPITMFTPNFMKTDAEVERGNIETYVLPPFYPDKKH